jgi:GT2 family glycosyltransferase
VSLGAQGLRGCKSPRVSVVLPTHNRLDRLRQVLGALERQDYSASCFEVVVVSDGSSDGTNDYLRSKPTSLALVPVILEGNRGPAAARNYGLVRARGEIVLFVDDDVVPSTRLLSEHVAVHEEHEDAVVIGPMLTPLDFRPQPWVRWMHDRLAEQYESMVEGKWRPTARQFYTGNASVPRRRLIESGGFDPSFTRAEDVELAYRLAENGLSFVFNPKAIGYHYEERTFASWMAIPYAYGRNDVTLSHENGQRWLLDTVPEEFRTRHPIHRFMVYMCLGRTLSRSLAVGGFRLVGQMGRWLGFAALQRLAYSSIFNLRYYQGVADGLGGRRPFFSFFGARQATPLCAERDG